MNEQLITFILHLNWSVIIPTLISIIALIFSGIALWKTNFSKFNAIFSVGDLRLRIYPIKNGKQKWFIASIDIPMEISNDAAQAGRITDIRIKINYPNLPIKDHWEIFKPKWDVDSIKFRQCDAQDRFKWINDATLSDWKPFIILSKQTVSKHFIFETTWKKPVIQNRVIFGLEIKTNINNKWFKVDEWELFLFKEVWSELAEVGTSIATPSKGNEDRDNNLVNPPDLHKYTGTDEKIPHGGFKAKPSYMDFPNKKGSITG